MNRTEFSRCAPEDVGIPSGAILRLLDRLEQGGFTDMHGLMILRHDRVCAEGWWAPYAPERHHALHSLSKTWTATAVGLAEYAGLLCLSDRVCDLLADRMPAELSANAAQITVRDLLMMASGSETEKGDYSADWITDFFARPVEHAPGTFWRYNSHGTAVLSAIVEAVSGMSMLDFLDERLFRIIGVDASHVMCRRGADGTCLGGHGMFTTTEDNLRLMRLYLRDGVWERQRLLSESFVRDAVSPLMDTAPAHAHTPWIYDNARGYGYQIWMCRPEGAYRADGAYGQFVVVDPARDLIVAINEGAYIGQHMSHNELELLRDHPFADQPLHGPQETLNALFDILWPTVHPEVDALPPSGDSAVLQARLRRLAVPRPAAEVSNRTYRSLALELSREGRGLSFRMLQGMGKRNPTCPGAERIHLRTEPGLLRVDWDEDGISRQLTADMTGGWWSGSIRYTDYREIVSEVACAAWWQGDALELAIRWIETEAVNRFTFCQQEGRVDITKWVEAGPPDALLTETAEYLVEEWSKS